MSSGHKTIVAMLAVVVVLLAVNIVQGPRAAEAVGAEASGAKGGEGPRFVSAVGQSDTVWRLWSDGQINEWIFDRDGCDELFMQGIVALPVVHEAECIGFNVTRDERAFFRFFADGRVDYLPGGEPCVLFGNGSGTACLGDVDRNGETNFTDLLFVLNDWGECE